MRPKAHPHSIYVFDNFRLETKKLMLYRDDDEVAIPPKAVETLAALVARNGEIISKDELMEAVWADTVVEESNLARYIHLLRLTLGNQQDGKAYIDTYRRRGYRFNGQVAVRARSEAVDVSAGRAALSKDSHAFRREGTTGKVVSISDWQTSSLAELDRAPRHNLPALLSSFVGRASEIAELKELLSNDDIRLVTLTGPGGTGKTRLGVAVGREVLEEFSEGVYFIELATVTDPSLVAPTIVAVLRAEHTGAFPVIEDLKTYLRRREILLILDNFEQVVEAGSVVKDLLEACPGLKILTTSREPLRVRGEQEYRVDPFELPRGSAVGTLDQLSNSAAVVLFIERAKLVDPRFKLDSSNAEAIASICRRLDGLPLAIELAAVRVRILAPAKLAERLTTGLKLLTGGARDFPDRQRTMRSAIAWSYDLLDETEQTLFRQLAVFVGGFTLEAAEAVVEIDEGREVFEVLTSLVEKNLLRQREGPGGEPRFSFLETIREFALELLQSSGKADATRNRHVAFFLSFAKKSEHELLGSEQPLVLNRLDAEDDNFRAALFWLRQRGNSDLELKLAGALSPCWLLKGHIAEGADRLRDILSRASHADSPGRSKALVSLGQLIWMIGDYEATIEVCEEGLAIANRLGFEPVAARCLFYIALSRLYRYGDAEKASLCLEEALDRSRAVGFDMGEVFALTGLADVYKRTDAARADQVLKEAVAVARRTRNHVSLSVALANAARVGVQLQNFEIAEQQAKESLALRAELGDWCGVVLCLEPLAGVALAKDEPERAVLMLAAIDRIIEASGASSPAVLRSDHERNRDAAQLALGDAEFYNLWRQGRRMSPEQVVEFALERHHMERVV